MPCRSKPFTITAAEDDRFGRLRDKALPALSVKARRGCSGQPRAAPLQRAVRFQHDHVGLGEPRPGSGPLPHDLVRDGTDPAAGVDARRRPPTHRGARPKAPAEFASRKLVGGGAFVKANRVRHGSIADPEWRLGAHDEQEQHCHRRQDSHAPGPAEEERDYRGNQQTPKNDLHRAHLD